jgi:hypothetical protein
MAKHEFLILESRSPKDIFNNRFEASTLQKILKLQDAHAKNIEFFDLNHLVTAIKYAEKERARYVHISVHGNP